MRQSVLDAFIRFSSGFEGVLPHMYRDRRDLVTCAIGNLIDPIGLSLPHPWVHQDGTPATRSEIIAEWQMMKSYPGLGEGGWRAAAKIATLFLTPAGMHSVVSNKLTEVAAQLRARWPSFETFPADGQMGCVSWAWAAGAEAHAPKFDDALLRLDFAVAAIECHLRDTDDPRTPQDESNPGLHPRNIANEILFQNAACVVADGLDPETFYYPLELKAGSPIVREIPPEASSRVNLPDEFFRKGERS